MGNRLRLIAVAVAVIVCVPGLFGEFVLDDPVAIEQSVCVTGDLDLGRIWNSNFWCEQGARRSIESWRPLTVLAWWMVYRTGLGALGFALLGLGLHAFATLLVHGLGRDVGLSEQAAGWSAIVFAGLAIHVDALGTAVGTAELLSAVLVLATVRGALAGRAWLVATGVLAVLAKESGVLAFALVATLAALRHGGPSSRRRLMLAALLAAGTFAALLARAQVLGSWTAMHVPAFVNPLVDAALVDRVFAGVGLIGRYTRLAIVGGPLAADYAADAIDLSSFTVDTVIGSFAVVIVVAAAVTARRSPKMLFLALWLAGGALFVSNIPFVLPAVFAERLFYLPSVPLVLLSAYGLLALAGRYEIRSSLGRLAVAIFAGVQCSQAIFHIQRYTDERAIVAATVDTVPGNARARMWLAGKEFEAGAWLEARTHAAAAQAVRPRWGAPIAMQAMLDDQEGNPETALTRFRRAMELSPEDPAVADPFIQFLLRYGHIEPAHLVYGAHASARGGADPTVTVPPPLRK